MGLCLAIEYVPEKKRCLQITTRKTLFFYYKNVYLCCCAVKNKHKNVILLLWRLFCLCFVLWFFIYKNKELSGFFLAFSLVGTLLD